MTNTSQHVSAEYLGMPLQVDAADASNKQFFAHCANGKLHLQQCADCNLHCYPPTNSCPWCGHPWCDDMEQTFTPVQGTGAVYSYAEVHHAIQPAFAKHVPYLILIVELDVQKDQPNQGDAIRIAGNLASADGTVLSGSDIEAVGIGSRVKMVFKQLSDEIALPMWALDETPGTAWRYSVTTAR